METLISSTLDKLTPELAIWFLILWIVIDKYGARLTDLIVKVFPAMANSHFSAKAKDTADRREFDQNREAALLKEKLAESEANRQRQIEREQQYFNIINRSITFSQETLLKEIDKVSPPIVEELANLRRSIDRLAARYDGKQGTTQDKILERIG